MDGQTRTSSYFKNVDSEIGGSELLTIHTVSTWENSCEIGTDHYPSWFMSWSPNCQAVMAEHLDSLDSVLYLLPIFQ